MQKRWENRNIDLVLLTTHIGNFLKEKDFEAIKGEIPNGFLIFAENSPHFRLDGYVSVTIEGKPDDFTIKLELCREEKRSLTPLLLTTMFVGGYFLSRKLRSDEDWMRLEKEFWRLLDKLLLLSAYPGDSVCSHK